MKYGLLTKATYDVAVEIERFSRLGFDYTEISMEGPCATPEILSRDSKRILTCLKRNKMFCIGHTAYWSDFGTSMEMVRQGWINEAKAMITASRKLNMEYLNFHFYPGDGFMSKIPLGRGTFLNNFIKSLRHLTSFAKRNNVTLMLENLGPRDSSAYLIEDFKHVIDNVPLLMVHLDVAHAFIEGGNRMIDNYISTFSDRIVHIHAHDNHGKDDEHLPIGKGRINFNRVASSLKKIGYDRTLTFEVFTSNSDARISRKRFERIWDRK